MNSFKGRLDMHFHTNFSDGRLGNEELVKKAAMEKSGFFIATDHDIVNVEFPVLAKKGGFKSAEGVEISILDENYGYFHITAYAKRFSGEILEILEGTRNGRRSKIYKQIKVLQGNGIMIHEDCFFAFFEDKGINVFNLNIYHLASYIYRFPENISRIREITGEEMDKIEFLKRCLRDEGDFSFIGSATVPEYTPDIRDIIYQVKQNDGITSIAHPNFSFKPDEYRDRIRYFLGLGMDSIEINSKATENQIQIARKCTGKDNLLTFGSDCHFTPYSEEDHGELGEVNPHLDDEVIEENLEKIDKILNIS